MATTYIPTRQELRAALREKVIREYPLLSGFLYPARIPAMQHPTSWPTHAALPAYLVNNTGSEDLMLPRGDALHLLDDLMEDHYAHIATETIRTASDMIVGYGRGSATVDGTVYPDVPGSVFTAIRSGATREEVRRMYESMARRFNEQQQQPHHHHRHQQHQHQQQEEEQPRRGFSFPSAAALDALMAQHGQPQVPPPPAAAVPAGPAQPAPTHWNGMRILALDQPSLNAAARHTAANHQSNPHGASPGASTDARGPSAWEQRQAHRLREVGFAAYREPADSVEDAETKELNELVAEYKRNMVWCRQNGLCLRKGFVPKVMQMEKKAGVQKKKQDGVSGGRIEKKVKKHTDKKRVFMGSLAIRPKKED